MRPERRRCVVALGSTAFCPQNFGSKRGRHVRPGGICAAAARLEEWGGGVTWGLRPRLEECRRFAALGSAAAVHAGACGGSCGREKTQLVIVN